MPIYVLGLGGPIGTTGSLVPIIVTLIGTLWGFFIHANVRWRFGPLEWLISTPAFHHWHHTKAGPFNRNYSSTLPWLDWIYGTLHLPAEWPTEYGIKAKIPDSLAGQLAYPWMAPAPTSSTPDQGPVAIAKVEAPSSPSGSSGRFEGVVALDPSATRQDGDVPLEASLRAGSA